LSLDDYEKAGKKLQPGDMVVFKDPDNGQERPGKVLRVMHNNEGVELLPLDVHRPKYAITVGSSRVVLDPITYIKELMKDRPEDL
jgi:hypothetical protein